MIEMKNNAYRSSPWLIIGLAISWLLLTNTGSAQTETQPTEAKAAELRPGSLPGVPATAQTPVPFSPSAFSWLRFAFAPSRGEVPANQLPFESIRDNRSPFEGSALGGVSRAEFHRAYREVARQEELEQQRRVLAGEEYGLPPSEQFIPADPLQAAATQLRASARNLDTAAADLEDAGKYAEADRMRGSAQRLRREARELAKPDTDEIRILE